MSAFVVAVGGASRHARYTTARTVAQFRAIHPRPHDDDEY